MAEKSKQTGGDESESDFEDYDYETNTISEAMNLGLSGRTVSRKDLEEGTIIDSTEIEDDMEKLQEEQQMLWRRKDFEKYLSINPMPDDSIGEGSVVFGERIKVMEVVCSKEVKNAEGQTIEQKVYKRILRHGTGPVIDEQKAVLYHLNAFTEGILEPFDSTWLRGKPYLHKLNSDTILPGVLFALKTMRQGERCELIVDPEYAFLQMGCPPRVPPNAVILFIVEIIKIYEEGTLIHFDALSWDEKQKVPFETIYELCDLERKSANGYFKDHRLQEAGIRYKRAIRCLEQLTYKTNEDDKKAKDMMLKLYCNMAITLNKLQRPLSAMHNCKKAIAIDENSVKANYNYAQAKFMNGENEAAKHYALLCQKFAPFDKNVTKLLSKLDHRIKGEQRLLDQLHTRMGKGLFGEK